MQNRSFKDNVSCEIKVERVLDDATEDYRLPTASDPKEAIVVLDVEITGRITYESGDYSCPDLSSATIWDTSLDLTPDEYAEAQVELEAMLDSEINRYG